MSTNINFSTSLGVNDGTRVNFNLVRSILLKSEGRAVADGGYVEAELCSYNILNNFNYASLLKSASLVVTPNSVKEGKLYSVIPSDGSGDFTFTRATTATRVNSAGLVEVLPYNLIPNSNNISLSWSRPNVTIVSSNNLAPDGTLTATRLSMPNGSGSQLFNFFPSVVGSYTTSIWVRLVSGSGNFKLGFFDNVSILTDAITVTSTWQRFSVTKTTAAADGARGCWLYSDDLNQVVEVFGGQVVEGTNALPYQKTETRLNIPRLDYSLGGCPNILLEPQRTNLALRSQEFDNASWVKVNASITANTTASPDGTSNADSLVENTATNLHLTYQFFTSTATTYTYSCYIKPDTRTRAYLRTDTSVGTTRTLFDLTGAGSVVTLAHTSATITLVGNGWYRCTVTFTEGTGAGSRLVAVEGAVGTSISYAGNGLTAFYLYGAQLEAGAYATSYIPTTSASVTRNLDTLNKTGISSLIGQTEGTMFCEVNYKDLLSPARFITISNGTNNNVVQFYLQPNTAILRAFIAINGVVIFDDSVTTLSSINQFHKIAIAYKSGDIKIYVNGSSALSLNTTYSNSVFDRLSFSSQTNTFLFGGLVKQTVLWKERLTNTELAQLTTI